MQLPALLKQSALLLLDGLPTSPMSEITPSAFPFAGQDPAHLHLCFLTKRGEQRASGKWFNLSTRDAYLYACYNAYPILGKTVASPWCWKALEHFPLYTGLLDTSDYLDACYNFLLIPRPDYQDVLKLAHQVDLFSLQHNEKLLACMSHYYVHRAIERVLPFLDQAQLESLTAHAASIDTYPRCLLNRVPDFSHITQDEMQSILQSIDWSKMPNAIRTVPAACLVAWLRQDMQSHVRIIDADELNKHRPVTLLLSTPEFQANAEAILSFASTRYITADHFHTIENVDFSSNIIVLKWSLTVDWLMEAEIDKVVCAINGSGDDFVRTIQKPLAEIVRLSALKQQALTRISDPTVALFVRTPSWHGSRVICSQIRPQTAPIDTSLESISAALSGIAACHKDSDAVTKHTEMRRCLFTLLGQNYGEIEPDRNVFLGDWAVYFADNPEENGLKYLFFYQQAIYMLRDCQFESPSSTESFEFDNFFIETLQNVNSDYFDPQVLRVFAQVFQGADKLMCRLMHKWTEAKQHYPLLSEASAALGTRLLQQRCSLLIQMRNLNEIPVHVRTETLSTCNRAARIVEMRMAEWISDVLPESSIFSSQLIDQIAQSKPLLQALVICPYALSEVHIEQLFKFEEGREFLKRNPAILHGLRTHKFVDSYLTAITVGLRMDQLRPETLATLPLSIIQVGLSRLAFLLRFNDPNAIIFGLLIRLNQALLDDNAPDANQAKELLSLLWPVVSFDVIFYERQHGFSFNHPSLRANTARMANFSELLENSQHKFMTFKLSTELPELIRKILLWTMLQERFFLQYWNLLRELSTSAADVALKRQLGETMKSLLTNEQHIRIGTGQFLTQLSMYLTDNSIGKNLLPSVKSVLENTHSNIRYGILLTALECVTLNAMTKNFKSFYRILRATFKNQLEPLMAPDLHAKLSSIGSEYDIWTAITDLNISQKANVKLNKLVASIFADNSSLPCLIEKEIWVSNELLSFNGVTCSPITLQRLEDILASHENALPLSSLSCAVQALMNGGVLLDLFFLNEHLDTTTCQRFRRSFLCRHSAKPEIGIDDINDQELILPINNQLLRDAQALPSDELCK